MRLTALALLLASVLSFASCGGGSGEKGSEAAPPDTATETAPGPSSAAHGDRSGGRSEEGEEPAPGGEASIEGFGSEASGGERTSIEDAFRDYLDALAERDYGTACSYLARSVQESLEQLVVKRLKGKGCVGILPKLLAPSAPAIARAQANGQITKVRVEGGSGFVVFHAPGADLYQQTMVSEGGGWKVATVAASVLVPEL